MQRKKWGKTDMEVSLLGFGASEIGQADCTFGEVEKLLGQALDSGLNVIDTAECYGDSEEKIGKAIGHRRKDYYLFTKCGHASGMELPDWHPRLLEQSIDRSLRRLGTDYLDLIQLHSCSRSVIEDEEAMSVLLRAKKTGKVRYVGYSGDSESALFAVRSGLFDALQISVNIADQEAIQSTIPEAVERGMGIIAKRPIANAVWRWGATPPPNPYHLPYWERLRQLDYGFLANRDPKSTEIAEIALRFTIGVDGIGTVIVGTTKPERWLQNQAIVEKGPLPEEEWAAIRTRWLERSADRHWVGV
ncbi:aldo/keto reductase [Cohnella hongkongensis]|uniref:Aldo/keto reductase n=1 Tax=Cohnella hongkongensis TaxID=178337 RepID=A0ABV9FA53_9BACL